jgi:hypothetical protein
LRPGGEQEGSSDPLADREQKEVGERPATVRTDLDRFTKAEIKLLETAATSQRTVGCSTQVMG